MTRHALAATVALGVAVVGTACTVETGGKTGGEADPVVLRFADGYETPAFEPAVAHFVKRVEELSDGEVTIETVRGWGDLAPDFEQQIVADVAAGEADVGWVGTRVFDTFGVTSFQALTAPMLIDSYPLEEAVINSDLPEQMLAGLDELDVTGLAVLGDGLRKPIAQDRAMVRVEDWRDVSFNTFRSDGQMAAIEAAGAVPVDDLAGDVPYAAAERNLLIYKESYVSNYRYVAANVNLWPQTVALIANPDSLAELSDEQRGWVERAAEEAAAGSTAMFDHDQDILAAACAKGARFADASPEDLAALRAAFDGVYDDLERDSDTGAYIEQIEALKADLPAVAPLRIPSNCAVGAVDAARDPVQGLWESELLTEGQMVQAFVAAGGSEREGHAWFAEFGGGAEESVQFRVDFQHGSMAATSSAGEGPFVDSDGSAYTVEGDTLTFVRDHCESSYEIRLEKDTLRLLPIEPCPGHDAPYEQTFYGSFPFTRVE
jgi:TRAP-type C4-dicarboxylate transport system substrate-binding protein